MDYPFRNITPEEALEDYNKLRETDALVIKHVIIYLKNIELKQVMVIDYLNMMLGK